MVSKKIKMTGVFCVGVAVLVGYQILKATYIDTNMGTMERDAMRLLEQRRKNEEMKE